MLALVATAAIVLLIGWTAKTLTAKHHRDQLHELTDREITEALAPYGAEITTWPAHDPRDPRDTHNPD